MGERMGIFRGQGSGFGVRCRVSNRWKIFFAFFQSLEDFEAIFPIVGKLSGMVFQSLETSFHSSPSLRFLGEFHRRDAYGLVGEN